MKSVYAGGMTFERTRDLQLVRSILIDPTQYRMASDDATAGPENFTPNDHPDIWHVIAREGERLLGLFTFIPQNAVCFEVHAAVLPCAWGPNSRDALRGAVAWMWRSSWARRIVASIPADNRLAIRLARDCGFVQYGRNPASFLRGGRLLDQIITGVSRPERNLCPVS